MDWFEPDDRVVLDPAVDRDRVLRGMAGLRGVRFADRLLLASKYHGIFDVVADALPEYGVVATDRRDQGYLSLSAGPSTEMTVYRAPGPAPWAAQTLEVLIASGARSVVFVNGCGSLDPVRDVGSLLIPKALVREEGTSYHYVPAARSLETSLRLRERLRDISASSGHPVQVCSHWTTDAIYRETFAKVRRYSALGVASVDMELSALVAVAEYRGVELAAILVVTDVLTEKHTWDGAVSPQFRAGAARAARIAIQAVISD